MASNLRKWRDFSLLGPLGLLLFGRVGFASELVVGEAGERGIEASAMSSVAAEPTRGGEVRERVLPSGLRVWARSRPGLPLEVCTATRATASTDRERIAIRILARLLERGGYRSSGDDYHELLTSRGIETRASLERGALVFCAKGPERELPLLLWNAAGRFARQALVPTEFSAAKKLARERPFSPLVGEKLAERRLSELSSRSTDEELESSTTDEVWTTVTLEDVRVVHEKLFFDARTTLALDGGFSFDTLDRLVGEHLRLPRSLASSPSPTPDLPTQTSARYAFVEESGRTTMKAFVGAPSRGTLLEDRLAPVALSEELARKSPKSGFSLEIAEGFAFFSTEAASLVELEERRIEFSRVAANADLSKVALAALPEKRREKLEQRVVAGGARTMALAGARGVSFEDWGRSLVGDVEIDRQALVRRVRETFSERRTTVVELLPRGFVDPFLDAGPKTHSIVVGETLGTIAFRYGTTPEAILEKNAGLELSFRVGGELKLPKGAKKAGPPPLLHRVEPGENLTKIAKKYGVSVDELRRVNGLPSDAIASGVALVVAHDVPRKPSTTATERSPIAGALPERPLEDGAASVPPIVERAAPQPAPTSVTEGDSSVRTSAQPTESAPVAESEARARSGTRASETTRSEARKENSKPPVEREKAAARFHVVEKGDQLLKIARRHGVSIDDLCAWNGLRRDSVLFVGRKLRLSPR